MAEGRASLELSKVRAIRRERLVSSLAVRKARAAWE